MRLGEGLRGEALLAAFGEALAGKDQRLFLQLENLSGLPGTRMNLPLAQAFATECMHKGKAADALAFRMAELHPDVAPGGSPKEILPACGVLAIGARASEDPKLRKRALAHLHDASEDLRFRVREVVPFALAKMGSKMGDALVHEVASWTDGFFQAAAVVLAMGDPQWLPVIDDVDAALARLDEAYLTAKKAPRAAARYPGRKALVDALGATPAVIATRFGVPMFDLLARWSNTEMPELRGAIEATLKSGKLAGRYKDEIDRVRAALDASVPPPRDPTILRQGMRGRGKKRDRR
ncbi:MAG: hypothetical protein JST00_42085 [Deltaproteobacteria bacterium]|nr:hypothetical protein [Deltaproteobacteria bacterium]